MCVCVYVSYSRTHVLTLEVNLSQGLANVQIGPDKIFFHFEAFVHESIILSLPPSTCSVHTIAIPLRDFCATYDPPLYTPFVCHTAYNIGNCNIV